MPGYEGLSQQYNAMCENKRGIILEHKDASRQYDEMYLEKIGIIFELKGVF